jgi:hypothetical protein
MSRLTDLIKAAEDRAITALLHSKYLRERVPIGRASLLVQQQRPDNWVKDEKTGLLVPDPRSYKPVGEPEKVWNLITNAGRDFLHAQCYSTGPGANGLNYIALSNDTVGETTASTTLSTEIAANGLSRAVAAYAHSAGTNTTTLDKTFTCATANQACQKAALFTAGAAGTMNHVLGFTQRSLIVGDTIQVTFTITLG